MFTAAYIYKNHKSEGDKSCRAYCAWEPHESVDTLINSGLWSASCDMDEPKYYDSGDYCTLCTRNPPDTLITSELTTWGACKECAETDQYMGGKGDWLSNVCGYEYQHTVYADVKGRVVAFFWLTDTTFSGTLVDEAITHLNQINASLGITRTYTNGTERKEAKRKEVRER